MTTRNATTTTVSRGRSGGRAKAKAEAEKVQENAAKVAALNTARADADDQWGAATKEHEALVAWQKAGSKGDRPATPTLDALNGELTTPKRQAKAKERKQRAQGPLAAATAQRRTETKNHRGKGKTMTDAQIVALIKKLHAKHPEAGQREVCEYIYWVEGVATGTARTAGLWAHVVDGAPLPEATAKAPAKKAPAKKQAATVSQIGKTAAAAKRVEQRRTRKAS